MPLATFRIIQATKIAWKFTLSTKTGYINRLKAYSTKIKFKFKIKRWAVYELVLSEKPVRPGD